jgi:hypothetical protein
MLGCEGSDHRLGFGCGNRAGDGSRLFRAGIDPRAVPRRAQEAFSLAVSEYRPVAQPCRYCANLICDRLIRRHLVHQSPVPRLRRRQDTAGQSQFKGALLADCPRPEPRHAAIRRQTYPRVGHHEPSGRLKLDELITRRYALDDVNQAYADMRSGVNIRGVVDFIPAG